MQPKISAIYLRPLSPRNVLVTPCYGLQEVILKAIVWSMLEVAEIE